jgi:two-component SAPR family response regulator
MKRTSIAIPESGKYSEAVNQLEQAIRLNSTDAKVQFFLEELHLLNRDRQSALAQYKKLALVDIEFSIKFIRGDLLQ